MPRRAAEEARAAEAKRLAEEEARLREQEVERAKIESELQMVAAARQGVSMKISQHDFSGAIRELKLSRSNCKTDEGREALAIAVERCERLQRMKEFFIEQLSAKPMPWGWGHGPSATDVNGADKRNVMLKDRRVPWAEVPPSQMLRFADYYMDSRNVLLRQQADIALAAAIYCFEVAGERGVEKSELYASQAVSRLSSMRRHVERLIPAATP